MQIFYADKGHSELRGSTVSAIDACVDLCFLVDIIITFRTTFLDKNQSFEVKDPHIIGLRYLKGSFTLDLISSVPFTSFITSEDGGIETSLLEALGLLKLLRLQRLQSTV